MGICLLSGSSITKPHKTNWNMNSDRWLRLCDLRLREASRINPKQVQGGNGDYVDTVLGSKNCPRVS